MSKLLGLWGVFVSCFGAATILPGLSEAEVGLLVQQRVYPVTLLVGVATVGNWLGSVFTYATGYYFGSEKLVKWLRMSEARIAQMHSLASRYGAWGGLLGWAPVVGDPLVACMGLVRTPVVASCLTMLVGKVVRYVVIAWCAMYFVE